MRQVLIFDRALPVRMRIKEILSEHNIHTTEVETDGDALNVINRMGDALDMMIVDVAFDSNYGYEFIKRIKATNPRLSVIICTSSNKRADFIRGVQSGASDYILKPFEDDIFLKRVLVHLTNPIVKNMSGTSTGLLPGQKSNNFFDIIKTEKYKANKGKYPLTVFAVMFFKSNETENHSFDKEYMRFAENHFEDIQSRLWESDEIIVFGPQTFLGILPFCDERGFGIAKQKILQYLLKDSGASVEYNQYEWVVTGVTLKTESDYHTETEEIIDVLKNRMSIETQSR